MAQEYISTIVLLAFMGVSGHTMESFELHQKWYVGIKDCSTEIGERMALGRRKTRPGGTAAVEVDGGIVDALADCTGNCALA